MTELDKVGCMSFLKYPESENTVFREHLNIISQEMYILFLQLLNKYHLQNCSLANFSKTDNDN